MSQKIKVRPAIDPATGAQFVVYNPQTGRDIPPEGEALFLDPHLERRILKNELVRVELEAVQPPAEPTRNSRRAPTTESTTNPGD